MFGAIRMGQLCGGRYSHGGSWKGQTAQSCTLSHGNHNDNKRNPGSGIFYHLLYQIFLYVSFHAKETSMLFKWTFSYHHILTADLHSISLVYLVLCLINRFMQHRLYMCKALSNIYTLKSINVLRVFLSLKRTRFQTSLLYLLIKKIISVENYKCKCSAPQKPQMENRIL